MTTTPEPKRLKELIRLLGGLQNMYEQLLRVVGDKIDAMRRADIPALRTLSQQEQSLAGRLQAREGLRRQMMDAVGKEMGLPAATARAMPVSQIASRLPELPRERLLHVAKRLRDVAARTAQANRIAGAVSREILSHLTWVFSSVRAKDGKTVGYSGVGAAVGPRETRIFEAVG